MKRRGLKVIISLAFALGVLLFFPIKTDKQYFFHTGWRQELPESFVFGNAAVKNAALFPFAGQNIFGYCSETGDIVYSEPVVYDVTGSSEYFINYSSVAETLLIKNEIGEIVSTIAVVGFPFIRNDRLFILDVDRCGVSEWDFTGKRLWGKRYSSIITCFDCNKDEAIIGLIDGHILLYNNKGEYVYRDEFTGSRIRTVYGIALSRTGSYFSVIEGIDPQKLMLFERREEGYVSVYSQELSDPFRREVFLQFDDDENYLFYEQNDVLTRLSVKWKTLRTFPVAGRPLGVSFSRPYKFHFIHSGNSEQTVVDMYNESGFHINRFYAAPDSSVTFRNRSLFFQRSGSIHHVTIEGADR